MQPTSLPARLLFPLLPPAVVLLFALVALPRLAEEGAPAQADGLMETLSFAVYGLSATAAILAVSFNRSRVLFSVGVVALAHFALLRWPVDPRLDSLGSLIHGAACVMVPFDLLLFSIFRERGFLTRVGLLRLAFMAAQIVLVALYARGVADPAWLHTAPLPLDLLRITSITQPGLLLFGLAAAGILVRLVMSGSRLDAGCLGALAASAGALHFAGQEGPTRLFLTAAVLILLVAVLQDSYGKAYIDELTEIPGRRALEEALLQLPRKYAIAMVDVDHFKKFNDRYGHDVGDQVLRRVAAHLRTVGGGGRAFRYGGEEFVILFRGNEAAEVEPELDALRRRIADAPFSLRGPDRPEKKPEKPGRGGANPRQARITVSIGVAGRDGSADAHAVIEAADRALYKAKKRGRNRVVPG